MTALRETNSQMFKELHETKSDLESVKSDLARLKHGASSDYQPGMLSGRGACLVSAESKKKPSRVLRTALT